MWLEAEKARNFNAVVWVLGEVNGYISGTESPCIELATIRICTRGKTPGKLKPLIQWAKPRSRILSMLGLCHYQIRLYRLGRQDCYPVRAFISELVASRYLYFPQPSSERTPRREFRPTVNSLRVPGVLPL